MISRAQFVEAVRSCIGTQVGHRGRTIGGALDCVGVPWAAYNVLADPTDQRMTRDYIRDRGREPTTLDPADVEYATPKYGR